MICKICGEKDQEKFYRYKNGDLYRICKKCCYDKNVKRKQGLINTRKKMKNKKELEIIKNKLNDKMYMDNAVSRLSEILVKEL